MQAILSYLFGMKSKIEVEGDRLVDGVKRAADAMHAFADRVEEMTGVGGNVTLEPAKGDPVLAVTESRRKHTTSRNGR